MAALRIRRENLGLTRANLQSARMRVRVGRASEADVIRWESSLATAQREMLDAFAQVRIAEIEPPKTLAENTAMRNIIAATGLIA